MKIKGKATILFDRDDGLRIELECESSSTTFAIAHLDKDQAIAALSRQALVDCEIKVISLDKIGKKMEIDQIEFVMPDCDYRTRKQLASSIAEKVCPKGWEPDTYFGSQGSFFTKDGKSWAKTFIRRYV